jgi:septation ring formation regulator EzrA
VIHVVNQVRRIFSDDGRGDRDYSVQEERLREAQKNLMDATDELTKASEALTDLLKSKGLIH